MICSSLIRESAHRFLLIRIRVFESGYANASKPTLVHPKIENPKMLRIEFCKSDFDVNKSSKRPWSPHNRIRHETMPKSGLRSSKRLLKGAHAGFASMGAYPPFARNRSLWCNRGSFGPIGGQIGLVGASFG